MGKRFLYWSLVLGAPSWAAPHNTIACGTLLGVMRDTVWTGADRSAHAEQVAHTARMMQSQYRRDLKGVTSGNPQFFFDDASGTAANPRLVLARLQGIRDKTSAADSGVTLVQSIALSLRGRENIKNFQGILAESLRSAHELWRRRFSDAYIHRASTGAFFFGGSQLAHILSPHAGLVLFPTGIAVLAQFESLLLQPLFMDHRINGVIALLDDIGNRRVGQNFMWARNYRLGKKLKDVLLNSTPEQAEIIREKLAYDARSDDRGLAGYLLGRPAVHGRATVSGPPTWVGVDMMLRWHQNEPILSILVRHADAQPVYEAATESTTERAPQAATVLDGI